jgi:kynurenine formamidase
MCSNTGTYVDSPFHRYADGADLSQLSLERLADLEAVMVNVSGAGQRSIGHEHFLPYDLSGKAVLVHTGWDRHWRTDSYFENHPFLTQMRRGFSSTRASLWSASTHSTSTTRTTGLALCTPSCWIRRSRSAST